MQSVVVVWLGEHTLYMAEAGNALLAIAESH
jgi:hypothetical protein